MVGGLHNSQGEPSVVITYQPVEWLHDRLRILDQTLLPREERYFDTDNYLEVAEAIKSLKVRGAPAIGVAGAYGIALGALKVRASSERQFAAAVQGIVRTMVSTRPTARNLFWAAERMSKALQGGQIESVKDRLVNEAVTIHRRESEFSAKLSEIGASLITDGSTVLTHCDTGPLATTGYGTALGMIIRAHQQGKDVNVLVDETRPLLQGARLTTWELQKASIPFTLITDSMAGYFMSRGQVGSVVVGADRIAANGDTANKIGTYSVAVLAKENQVPFYVAAPTSTFDLSLKSGTDIEIEHRRPDEITHIRGVPIAPDGVDVANPAFDVTPARYIAAIVTERGIIKKPFTGLSEIFQ